MLRADGSTEDSNLKEASAEVSWKVDDTPRLTLAQRIEKLNGAADEIARQTQTHLFGTLNAALDKAGQVVSQHGKPLDPEAVFEALEKVQMEFDENRNPAQPSMVVPPALLSKAKDVLEQIENDPALQKRYLAIIERKWLDWRDREAARKLVG